MRLLHLVHQYPPEYLGGVELYTQTLARRLAARDHTVSVFAPAAAPAGSDVSVAVEDEVRVYRVPIGRRGPAALFFSTFRQPALRDAWRAALTQVRPDLVHVQHLMGLPVEVMATLTAAGIPFVVTLHDYYFFCANALLLTNTDQSICGGPRRYLNCAQCALARAGLGVRSPAAPLVAPIMAYRNLGLRRVLRQAARLIAPGAFVAGRHAAHFGWPADRVQVIAPGLDAPHDLPSEPRTDRLRVIFIGGIAHQKGVHVLIDAVKQLPTSRVQLSIYGDLSAFPDYAADLQKRARVDNIVFHGRVPHEEIWQVLGKSDVLVVPSLSYESSSLVSQEALAARVPVIASDLGALRETALAGGGLTFPAGDAAALRDQLQRLIDQPAEIDRLRAGLKAPRSVDEHVDDIESIYREVIAA
jgi:glycosyltransferase involved in cell wall biosynthesis